MKKNIFGVVFLLLCATNTVLAQQDTTVLNAIKQARILVKDKQMDDAFALLQKHKNTPTFRADSTATALLGIMYYSGAGTIKDEDEAAKWLKYSADLNCATAMATLGIMYYGGEGVKESKREAFKYMKKAAERGDITAIGVLGMFYMEGDGVEKDEKEAVRWLRKGATRGDAYSTELLAEAFESGNGVKADAYEAAKLYLKAAEKGDNKAAAEIGRLYLGGDGVPEDHEAALKWIEKSYKSGNSAGYRVMGILYRDGLCGKPKDEAKAARLSAQAAEKGDKTSIMSQRYTAEAKRDAQEAAEAAAAQQQRNNNSNNNSNNNQSGSETVTLNSLIKQLKSEAYDDDYHTLIEQGTIEAHGNYAYRVGYAVSNVRVVLIIPYEVSNQTPYITATHLDMNNRREYYFKSDFTNVQRRGGFTIVNLNYKPKFGATPDYAFDFSHEGYLILLRP